MSILADALAYVERCDPVRQRIGALERILEDWAMTGCFVDEMCVVRRPLQERYVDATRWATAFSVSMATPYWRQPYENA